MDESTRSRDELKDLKVRLPIRQHIELRSLKVLSDRTISEIVQDAVARYIESIDDDPTHDT